MSHKDAKRFRKFMRAQIKEAAAGKPWWVPKFIWSKVVKKTFNFKQKNNEPRP